MFKSFVRSIAGISFIAAANVCAQTDLGTHTLTISAELVSPNCSMDFRDGDSVDLRTLTPNQIANSTPTIDALALNYIHTYSAYGDLQDSYEAATAPITLRISCLAGAANAALPSYSRYSLKFGDTAQSLPGTLAGAASAGYGIRMTNAGTATSRNLGFFVHVKDVRGSASGGKNALVKPGENVALIDGLSFYKPSGSDTFIADFEVSPGVLGVNSDRSAEGGKFNTELIVTLKFN